MLIILEDKITKGILSITTTANKQDRLALLWISSRPGI